ncbi:MAG: hypothetical protein LBG99_08950 [Propionibacteriaceae bacterium]|jgi:hypothetical protein|nr:hypothetical protein [Propionibacteriaceae bacterium]
MKIEMAESLIYSWLRHVKECEVVQLNWSPSPHWSLEYNDDLRNISLMTQLMDAASKHFLELYGYDIFKKSKLPQLLAQAEIDAVGISQTNCGFKVYMVDVAFRRAGLNYGEPKKAVAAIVKKMIRSALCLVGYFGMISGEIVFASPKVTDSVVSKLAPCIADVNMLLTQFLPGTSVRLLVNGDFNDSVITPVFIASESVADMSELFVRSYQLIQMFPDGNLPQQRSAPVKKDLVSATTVRELKVGAIANTLLRQALEEGRANAEEIVLMQERTYSKDTFNLRFPLLVPADTQFETNRYYVAPLRIHGKDYHLCSQWYEVPGDDDRVWLLKWLKNVGMIESESESLQVR